MGISIDKFLISLPISFKGILGIFLVIGVVYACTVLLCKIGNRKRTYKN